MKYLESIKNSNKLTGTALMYASSLHRGKNITDRKYKKIISNIQRIAADQEKTRRYALLLGKHEMLCNQIKSTKREIKWAMDARERDRSVLHGVARRLIVLAKDAIKAGLIPFEDYTYIWNNLATNRSGLNIDFINTLCSYHFQILREKHPLYINLEQAEKRVQSQLYKLDFQRPFIP